MTEVVAVTDNDDLLLVDDETERRTVERDGWMGFGVDTVVNEIQVRP
jgi:hypothetical protein